MEERDELIYLLGAVEALSRVYLLLLLSGRTDEARVVREVLLEGYILRLGFVADSFRVSEHVERGLPGDVLSVGEAVGLLKSMSGRGNTK